MNITEIILDILAPLECFICCKEGSVLCKYCIQQLPVNQPICFSCKGLKGDDDSCLPDCLKCPINRLYYASPYEGVVKQLVVSMKSGNLRSASSAGAMLMVKNLDLDKNIMIAPLPTATSRIRQRGYDQADLLAREISRLIGRPKIKFLLKNNQSRQVGSSKIKRYTNSLGAYRVINKKLLQGTKVVLVDDVMTTGASLSGAAKLLLENGASRVDVLVLALATKTE